MSAMSRDELSLERCRKSSKSSGDKASRNHAHKAQSHRFPWVLMTTVMILCWWHEIYIQYHTVPHHDMPLHTQRGTIQHNTLRYISTYVYVCISLYIYILCKPIHSYHTITFHYLTLHYIGIMFTLRLHYVCITFTLRLQYVLHSVYI